MQMIADLHTHTLCATHAYNTFNEMAVAAKEIGYCALAVTDHAPAMPDAPHSWHFSNWSAMPHVINDVVMLYGAEANVMDTKGGWICLRASSKTRIGSWRPFTAPVCRAC